MRSGPKGISVTEGESIEISCSISGIPSPEVTWHRAQRDVTSSEKRYVIDTQNDVTTLKIAKATMQDNAEFTLKLKNCAGSDSFKVKVDVKGQ